MKTGRPKKYKSKKALSDAVERYFRSISRTIPARDGYGSIIRNDDGEEIRVLEYIRPPSISSLCLYLGIDRSTWQNYCDGELHPEFQSVTALTRARIEAYLEEQLLTREKGVQGIIFNLQNNYGWRQKQEVELGTETRKSVERQKMNVYDKLAVITGVKAMEGFPEYIDEDGEDE